MQQTIEHTAPQPAERTDARTGINLLRIHWVRSLFLWRGFPYVFQAVVLGVFIALAVIGWGHLVSGSVIIV
jgi:hypothetical protein